MSLSNIILPDIVIADLYPKSLIQYDGVVTSRPAAQPVEKVEKNEPAPVAQAEPVQQQPIISQPIAHATQPQPTETATYKTLGNNKQHITIIVNYSNEVFLPEADLQFLTKMLSACKLNMADVAIVNYATSEPAIDHLKQQLQPKFILLFGVEPGAIQLPISFPAFKEQAYAGSTFLTTPSLQLLNQETEEAKKLKRQLWECLKKMFL